MVAPCAHDGACPMLGLRSWCHFVQRFERSSLQRITKVRADGGLARTYQVRPCFPCFRECAVLARHLCHADIYREEGPGTACKRWLPLQGCVP